MEVLNRSIGDQLVSGPATDVQDGKDIARFPLSDNGEEFGIDRLCPMRRSVIERGDRIVIYSCRFYPLSVHNQTTRSRRSAAISVSS